MLNHGSVKDADGSMILLTWSSHSWTITQTRYFLCSSLLLCWNLENSVISVIVLSFSLIQKNWRTESEPGCPGEACRTAISRDTATTTSVRGASWHGSAGEVWAVLPEALASCFHKPYFIYTCICICFLLLCYKLLPTQWFKAACIYYSTVSVGQESDMA